MDSPKRPLVMLPQRPNHVKVGSPDDRADVQVYRPFFLAGITTVLTVGCLLGAVALMGIATQGSYVASTWTPYVLAHANSQLFGWVGFFVMGFAMQQHGTSVARKTSFDRVAKWTLASMAAGIGLRFFAEPLAQVDPEKWLWLGLASGALQILAVALFAYNTSVNRHRKSEPMAWPTAFVFTSLGFLVSVSLLEPYAFAMSHQVDKSASVLFVAQWFSPLREMQFLGFVALMIFGVAASKFPGCLGFRDANKAWGLTALALWVTGLALRVVGWTTFFNSNLTPGRDTLYRLGAAGLYLGALCMTQSLGVFDAVRTSNTSQKFIRAAFAWLLVAGTMLVLEPVHLRAIGDPFSHAYTGGIRHALTVGFISQMIIGVGFHVVTRIQMIPEALLPRLWSVWWLLNIGNAGRVMLEVLTDYSAVAFKPMGFTGFIELVGLTIWGYTMARLILRRSYSYAAVC
ncbi:MAG TPA: hypothetical protein PKA27_05205 [Fimbriimonadaceae bacterium]|nr:hypothetical protein [Fimbriimonadaceae bacterium]